MGLATSAGGTRTVGDPLFTMCSAFIFTGRVCVGHVSFWCSRVTHAPESRRPEI